MRYLIAAALTLLLTPPEGNTHGWINRSDSLCTFDTAARTTWKRLTLGLTTSGRYPPVATQSRWLQIADAIQRHFRVPEPVTLPLWARLAHPKSDTERRSDMIGYGLDSELRFRLDMDHRLADTDIFVNTASPELNTALVAAVQSADSAGAFAAFVADRHPGTEYTFRLIDYPQRSIPAVHLAEVAVPTILVDEPARVVYEPMPIYPAKERSEGIEGLVDTRYIVTAKGRADPKSLTIVWATSPAFAAAARRVVRAGIFAPARVAGCPVPQSVAQRVTFTLR